MGKALGSETAFGERPAIVGDLTKKQFPLLRHAVPMGVQLDVGTAHHLQVRPPEFVLGQWLSGSALVLLAASLATALGGRRVAG